MYILTYGSLRKGCYNFNYFDMKYIETLELNGYELYSFGAYPGINEGKGKLVVDLMEINSTTMRQIDVMEWGAGYTDKKVEVLSEELQKIVEAKIYVYSEDLSKLVERKVPNGDWVKYLKNAKDFV